MRGPVVYVVTRDNNGVYKSIDEGATFTQTSTTVLTAEVTDIALGDRQFTHSVIAYGDGAATTPYYSFDDGATYQAGQNTVGKEVTYVGQDTYVFGSTNSASGIGSILQMSFDEGISIDATIDVSPLFNYAGAVYSNITVTGFDFPNSAGGYITIAGNQNNSSADQLLTRTFDRGVSFPDALILPGSIGIIRGVWTSPERNVVFAIGEPDTIRGVLYSINPSLTEAPVKVLDGITVGSITNDLTVKFASVPPLYVRVNENPVPTNTRIRSQVYFLDSAGRVYYSDDDGFTWQFRSQISAVCVDIVALSENTVLVLTDSPSAIYKSVDGGVTFTQNPQAWTSPKAMAYTFENNCQECNDAFDIVENVSPTQCIAYDRYMGPLCKAPYIYSELLESCAKPSTIVPTNLLLSLDYSGSVNNTEKTLFREFMLLLVDSIQDRLLDGSMEVAIIGWSSNACLQQTFTNDIVAIKAAINTDPTGNCNDALTNHSENFCLSLRTLHDQSVLRPTAENVLVVFTDSGDNSPETAGLSPIRGCNLSDIGLLPIVPSDNAVNPFTDWNMNVNSMYGLIKNAKTDLGNGVGATIMAVALGTLGERKNCRDFFITEPVTFLGPEYQIPSLETFNNKPYYFDGGTFDNAAFIADQIRLGLAAEIISSPECPDGCIGVGGIDGLGYCSCQESFVVDPCSYEIENCSTGEIVSVVGDQPVSSRNGFVVKLRSRQPFGDSDPFFYDDGTGCWLIRKTTTVDPNAFNININTNIGSVGMFNGCPACTNPTWYRFTDCLDDTFVLYTNNPQWQELLDSNITIITHNNYPNRCLLVENIGEGGPYEKTSIVYLPQFTGTGCAECPREAAVNFRLVNCDTDATIYCSGLTNDLQQYIGQVVNIEGFGSACWQVETESSPQPIEQDVIVTASYPGCPECRPSTIYQFVNCEEDATVVYSLQDFSQYIGQVINLQEYPGNCWSVSVAQGSFPTQNLTVDGNPYIGCPECIVTYYQLTNCANPDVFLISTSRELARYVDRTITAAGYPGLCFTVTPPQCDCIRATINGVEYDAYVDTLQFNGRNVYYITTDSGDELAIAWNLDPDRWELFDRNTSTVYGFSTIDTDCPFSNFWTIIQASPYIITTVTFCADRIYNIAPELDFDDCIPCINCI